MAASFTDAKAPGSKHVQSFDNNGSEGTYKDGWHACTFAPLSPWLNAQYKGNSPCHNAALCRGT